MTKRDAKIAALRIVAEMTNAAIRSGGNDERVLAEMYAISESLHKRANVLKNTIVAKP